MESMDMDGQRRGQGQELDALRRVGRQMAHPERSNGRSHQFDYLMLSQQASFSRSAVDPDEKILSHGRRTRQHAVHVFSGRDSSTVLRERLLKSLS